jgi:hypothetical protein
MAPTIYKRGVASYLALALISTAALVRVSASAQDVPPQLKPPEGQPLIVEAHAKGFQIYTCKSDGGAYTWALKSPEAELFDKAGKAVGRHFAGPTWEWSDRSQVTGKMMTSAPSPDADSIPWLLLAATGHSGGGVLARVTNIQRLNTKGGKAPRGDVTRRTRNKRAAQPIRLTTSSTANKFCRAGRPTGRPARFSKAS